MPSRERFKKPCFPTDRARVRLSPSAAVLSRGLEPSLHVRGEQIKGEPFCLSEAFCVKRTFWSEVVRLTENYQSCPATDLLRGVTRGEIRAGSGQRVPGTEVEDPGGDETQSGMCLQFGCSVAPG